MQNKTRLELADYEAENLARLQKLLARKWEFIYLQAEAQIKWDAPYRLDSHLSLSLLRIRVDKKRDKFERNVLDSQERAFWDVHRPAPGCVHMTEHDIKKLMRRKIAHITPRILMDAYRKSTSTATTNTAPASALAFAANQNLITMTVGLLTSGPTSSIGPSNNSSLNRTSLLRECDEAVLIDQLYQEIEFLKHRIDRRCLKTSKVCENYVSYFEQYAEFDPFLTLCEPSNPCKSFRCRSSSYSDVSAVGITDSTDLWELEKAGSAKEISARRVKRWSFSINELLKDGIGRDYFWKFLDKEYSSENLRFYEACIQLRFHTAQKDVLNRVKEIYNEFLSPGTIVERSDERWSALLFRVGAYYSINIDQRVMNMTKNNMSQYSNRYTFDEAQVNLLTVSANQSVGLFVLVGSHLQSDESRHLRSVLAFRSLQRIAPGWQEKGTSMPKEWNSRRSTFSVFHSCLGRLHVWLCTPLHKIIRLNVRMMKITENCSDHLLLLLLLLGLLLSLWWLWFCF